RRHTRSKRDWSSDVCSSDLGDLNFNPAISSGLLTFLLDEITLGPRGSIPMFSIPISFISVSFHSLPISDSSTCNQCEFDFIRYGRERYSILSRPGLPLEIISVTPNCTCSNCSSVEPN